MTDAPPADLPPPSRRPRLLAGLLAWYVAIWLVAAVDPVDRKDWLLENLLAVAFVAILIATHRRFRFSSLSYALIAAFLTLHAVGAHYTYAQVPVGFWLQDLFGLSRNHFDRFVHFSFGLFLAFPLRELFARKAGLRGFWSFYFPVSGVLSMSGFFEIVEAWVAQVVSPELGTAYLGTQGDEWDAQKDMTLAAVGALLAMSANGLLNTKDRLKAPGAARRQA